MRSLSDVGLTSYNGSLDAMAAASGIQAARLNAHDLIDSADILFKAERYSHATTLSVLAIEELGKPLIILSLYLGVGDIAKLWRQYRQHTSKTKFLNFAIGALAKKHFPSLSKDALKKVQEGPKSCDLDAQNHYLYIPFFL